METLFRGGGGGHISRVGAFKTLNALEWALCRGRSFTAGGQLLVEIR